MTVTRYSAISAVQVGSGTGLTFVGGSDCLTDETDTGTYADWVGYGVGTGSPRLQVSFGRLPDLSADSRLLLHVVGTAVRTNTGSATLTTSFSRLIPMLVNDGSTSFGHELQPGHGGYPEITGLAPGEVVECCIPFLPSFAVPDFQFANNIYVESAFLSIYFSFRLYGIYLTVQEGITRGESLEGVPYVAFDMYGGGLVTLDRDGVPLLSTGNSASFGVDPIAAWNDGSIGLPYPYLSYPFAVLQPHGSEFYSLAAPTGDSADRYELGGAGFGDLSLVPMHSSATVMIMWMRDILLDNARPVFWEFTRNGVLLNEWLPVIPPHSTTGDPSDNWFPQTGGRFGDKFIYNGSQNSPTSGRTSFAQGYGTYGGDVLIMDLTTGEVSIVIPDAQIGEHAGVGLGPPAYGAPFLSAICVDPVDGDIFLYLADDGYDDTRNDAEIWISRWSIDGVFKGKIGFNDDHLGAPYEWGARIEEIGGITCTSDGRLIFFISGSGPDVTAYGGNEYDGLLQLDKNLVPSDGSTAYAVPTPFWRSPNGTLEGIPGDVTKVMNAHLTTGYEGTLVRFS